MSDSRGHDSSPAWAVIDIDGVLADVGHRLHHLEGPRKDWDGFFGAMDDDSLIDSGRDAVRAASASGLQIVYLTGRPERYRRQTEAWLRMHGLDLGPVHMRPNRDRRPARVFKVGILRHLAAQAPIAYLLDDDHEVIQAARSAGFMAHHADGTPMSATLHEAQEDDGRT